MKTKYIIASALSLLAVETSMAQDTSFEATSYNTRNGDITYTTGTVQRSGFKPMDEFLRDAQRENAKNEAWANARQQRWEMEEQTAELKKQTQLLKQIADK